MLFFAMTRTRKRDRRSQPPACGSSDLSDWISRAAFWAPPEGTGRFSRRALSADLVALLDIGCVVLLALHEKHSRRSREIQSDRLLVS
jgi:hypothetical protein